MWNSYSGSFNRCPNVTTAKTNPSETEAPRVSQTNNQQCPGQKLEERDYHSDSPQRPYRQKGIRIGQEILARMFEGPNWNVFHSPGIKNISPRTSRANKSAKLRLISSLFIIAPHG